MQKHVKISFSKIISFPRKSSPRTLSVKCSENTFFKIYGEKIEISKQNNHIFEEAGRKSNK